MRMEIFVTIQWMVKVSRVFGLMQLSQSSLKPEYQVAKRHKMYPVFWICVFLILLPVQIYLTGFWKLPDFERAVANVYWSFLNPCGIIVALGCSYLNQKKICKIINRICNCIGSIKTITGNAAIYNTPWRYLLKFLLIWLSVVIVDLQYYYLVSVVIEHLQLLYLFLVISSSSIFPLLISSLLQSLKKGLDRTLGKELAVMVPGEIAFLKVRNLYFKEDYKKHTAEKIVYYRTLFHELYEIYLKVNEMFATSYLVIIGNCAVVTIVEAFSFYKKIMQPRLRDDPFIDFILRYQTVPWALLGLFTLYMVVHPCVEVTERNSAITKIVNRYLAHSKPYSQVAEELQKFSILLLHEKMNFSPHDMVYLNYSLLLSILGLAVSYIVLLTQFHQ